MNMHREIALAEGAMYREREAASRVANATPAKAACRHCGSPWLEPINGVLTCCDCDKPWSDHA